MTRALRSVAFSLALLACASFMAHEVHGHALVGHHSSDCVLCHTSFDSTGAIPVIAHPEFVVSDVPAVSTTVIVDVDASGLADSRAPPAL